MEKLIWIFQILLAIIFIGAALMKLVPSVEKMVKRKQLPPNGNPFPLRVLGILELFGVVGIILPQIINFFPILTPITAVCFCFVLLGALYEKIKIKESKMIPLIVIAFILAVIIAYYRF
jgi:membrane protease YdiL (CAAX protease family)